jgi:hypothetical protein
LSQPFCCWAVQAIGHPPCCLAAGRHGGSTDKETARYGLGRKRDRFTAEMLRSYLEALGVPPLIDQNLDFSNAVFLENLALNPEERISVKGDLPWLKELKPY